MKVSELIEQLKKCAEDADVFVHQPSLCFEEGDTNYNPREVVEAYPRGHNHVQLIFKTNLT
jgi:hypothetical protein